MLELNFSFKSLKSAASVKYAHELGKHTGAGGKVSFVFPSQSTYDPFGMLMISAALRQFGARNPEVEKRCILSRSDDATRYAGHMGFFKSISEEIPFGKLPGEARGSSTYVPITEIDMSDVRGRASREQVAIQQQIQSTARRLGAVLAQGNQALELTLTYVIREIMRNSEEHSESDSVWLCAQYWPTYDLVEIGILDEGIGIKQSLQRNRHYAPHVSSDTKALELSVKPGISEAYTQHGSRDEWSNSGYGLYIAKEICARLGGMFLLASGDSCYHLSVKDGSVAVLTEPTFISGTAICMRFHTDAVDRFEELRDEIIKDGQAEASLLKKAIKKASYSSGGLVELLK